MSSIFDTREQENLSDATLSPRFGFPPLFCEKWCARTIMQRTHVSADEHWIDPWVLIESFLAPHKGIQFSQNVSAHGCCMNIYASARAGISCNGIHAAPFASLFLFQPECESLFSARRGKFLRHDTRSAASPSRAWVLLCSALHSPWIYLCVYICINMWTTTQKRLDGDSSAFYYTSQWWCTWCGLKT